MCTVCHKCGSYECWLLHTSVATRFGRVAVWIWITNHDTRENTITRAQHQVAFRCKQKLSVFKTSEVSWQKPVQPHCTDWCDLHIHHPSRKEHALLLRQPENCMILGIRYQSCLTQRQIHGCDQLALAFPKDPPFILFLTPVYLPERLCRHSPPPLCTCPVCALVMEYIHEYATKTTGVWSCLQIYTYTYLFVHT